MKIERPDDKPPITISRFAEENGLTMVVNRPRKSGHPFLPAGKYEAFFKGCEVAWQGCSYKLSGWAETEDAAINEYARQISFKQLVMADGKKIEIPDLVVDRSKPRVMQPHHSMNQKPITP